MKNLIAALAVLLALVAFAPAASAVPRTPPAADQASAAATQGSCTPTVNASVRFFEDADTFASNNDSIWIVCNGGQNAQNGNLGNVPHTLPGGCLGEFDGETWNNCVTVVRVWLPSQFWRFCGYEGINMHGTILANLRGPYWPGEVRFTGNANDALTSFRIRYDVAGCS